MPNPWDSYPKKKSLKQYPPQHPPKAKKKSKEKLYADSMRNGNG